MKYLIIILLLIICCNPSRSDYVTVEITCSSSGETADIYCEGQLVGLASKKYTEVIEVPDKVKLTARDYSNGNVYYKDTTASEGLKWCL